MKISHFLVTGGNSFIGRHLINILIQKGVKISILVRNKKDIPIKWNNNYIKILDGDITSKSSLKAIYNSDVDVIFHLASYVHRKPKSEDEIRYVFKVNVEGTKNLLDSLCPTVKHIVFFSSVSVYGIESGFDIDELVKTDPVTTYGITKLKAEAIIRDWGKEENVKTTSLRMPLVYGPGNKGNIYKMVEAIDRGRFVMMGRGENKKSMVYVGNVTDAALAVVDRQRANNEVYVVTDGVDYTVKDLYETIAKGLGKKPLPFYIPISIAKGLAKIGDVGGNIIRKSLPFNSEVLGKLTSSLTFSPRKIQEELDFKPRYNLHNTINETIKWYKNSKL